MDLLLSRTMCSSQMISPYRGIQIKPSANNLNSSNTSLVPRYALRWSATQSLSLKQPTNMSFLPLEALLTSKTYDVSALPLTDDGKIGVLLLNLGGPETLENVQPFLFDLFADPPLARFISVARARKSKEGYASIGGGSPLRHITDAQAEELRKALSAKDVPAKVYVGMRYWHPFTKEAIEKIKKDGISKLFVLPLYPQFSISTSGSSLRLLESIFREDEYLVNMQHTVIPSWYQREGYIKAMGDLIEKELGNFDHPEKSRVGPMEWLKPYTDETIVELGKRGVKSLLAVPISFVSEHIETLEEIDVEYKELALKSGIEKWGRVPALGCQPTFILDLADAVIESLPYVGAMAASNLEARQSVVPLGSVEELLATYDSLHRELPPPVTV